MIWPAGSRTCSRFAKNTLEYNFGEDTNADTLKLMYTIIYAPIGVKIQKNKNKNIKRLSCGNLCVLKNCYT